MTSDLTGTVDGLPNNFKGVLVNSIVKGGPVDMAGIRGSVTDQYGKVHGGDVIVSIDRHPVIRFEDLITYLDEHKSVGDSVMLKVYRNGKLLDVNACTPATPISYSISANTGSAQYSMKLFILQGKESANTLPYPNYY